MKKVLILSLALILLLGMASYGTFAYFSDTETSAGNTFTAGVWVEECVCAKFNVSDFSGSSRKIFKYDASGSFTDSFNLHTDNGHPSGVASTGDYIYVLDQSDKRVYKYDCCGNLLGVSQTLTRDGSAIGNPYGLVIDVESDEMWVAVWGPNYRIYRYPLTLAFSGSGNLPATQEITGHSDNTEPTGLAIDDNYLYLLETKTENRVFRYPRGGGVGEPSKLLQVTETQAPDGGDLYSPAGAMVDGGTLWVVDDCQAQDKDKMYEYDIASLFPDDGTPVKANWFFELDDNNKGSSGV